MLKYAVILKILVGYYVYEDKVFLGRQQMELPNDLQVVQVKVPMIKSHQWVYLGLIVVMLVYMGIGKFILGCFSTIY